MSINNYYAANIIRAGYGKGNGRTFELITIDFDIERELAEGAALGKYPLETACIAANACEEYRNDCLGN